MWLGGLVDESFVKLRLVIVYLAFLNGVHILLHFFGVFVSQDYKVAVSYLSDVQFFAA